MLAVEDSHQVILDECRNGEESCSGDTVFHDESIKLKPRPGKKTRGRVKIKFEYIANKDRRFTTFSKRKTGLMKKAYELSALTGTQVMLLVASETGHVYTFATRKLMPIVTSNQGKSLIQTCLSTPDDGEAADPTLEGDPVRLLSDVPDKTDGNCLVAKKVKLSNSTKRDVPPQEVDGRFTFAASEKREDGGNNVASAVKLDISTVTQSTQVLTQPITAAVGGNNVQYLYTVGGGQTENVFTFVNTASQSSFLFSATPSGIPIAQPGIPIAQSGIRVAQSGICVGQPGIDVTQSGIPVAAPHIFPATMSMASDQGNSNGIQRTIFLVPYSNYSNVVQSDCTNGPS